MASDPSRLARVTLVALAAILLAPASARSQTPTASQRETARALMDEGRARRERHDLRGALSSFRAADAMMHVPTTGFEVARAQVALGELVEARDTLQQVLRWAPRRDEPRAFAEARANAQALDDDLAGRIPTLRLVLSNAPPDPHVTVDGVAIPAEAASAPIRVDPGHHVVTAGKGGAAHAELDLAERELRTISLALPAEEAPPPVAAAEPASGSEPHDPPRVARAIAITGFGVGAAGLAVGAVAGLMSIQKTNALKATCGPSNTCDPSTAGDLDAARSTATISTVAFVAGGVGLVVGLGAVVLGGRRPPEAPRTSAGVSVTPWIGPGTAGLRGSF
jgi:hypothetical protein